MKPVVVAVYDNAVPPTEWNLPDWRQAERLDVSSADADAIIRLAGLLTSFLLLAGATAQSNTAAVASAFALIGRPFKGSDPQRVHQVCSGAGCNGCRMQFGCYADGAMLQQEIPHKLQSDPGICWATERWSLSQGLFLASLKQWPGRHLLPLTPNPAHNEFSLWAKENAALAQLLWLDAMGFLLSKPGRADEFPCKELNLLEVDEEHRDGLQTIFARLVRAHVLLRNGLTAQQRVAALNGGNRKARSHSTGDRVVVVFPQSANDEQLNLLGDALLLGVPAYFQRARTEGPDLVEEITGFAESANTQPAAPMPKAALTIDVVPLADARIAEFARGESNDAALWICAPDPDKVQSADLHGMAEKTVLRISKATIQHLVSTNENIPHLGTGEPDTPPSMQG